MTTKIAKRTPRAIADVTEGTIFASVDIGAPIERVFAALTGGRRVGALVGFGRHVPHHRVGRRFAGRRALARRRAWRRWTPFSVEGDFLAIEPPSKIVQTWKAEWDGGQ